jgi:ribonuclease D
MFLLGKDGVGMTGYKVYKFDIDASCGLFGAKSIAIDTETLGLNNNRDRLCVVQMCDDAGGVHIVHFPDADYQSPNLRALLSLPDVKKIFHFARFDVCVLQKYLEVSITNIYCTKIASKLVRTYSDKHGLKELCKELLGVDMNKQQQSSYWGAEELSKEQIEYAASDVIHLHKLVEKLDVMLKRENRANLAQACFNFLPHRASLDLTGFENTDIFAHS